MPSEQLLVSQTLSRPLADYRVRSPAAHAVAQLAAVGKARHPGQRIQFILTRGHPGVHAWDLPTPLNPAVIDTKRYRELTLRAVATVLQPWGVKRPFLDQWLLHDWVQGHFYLGGVRPGQITAVV